MVLIRVVFPTPEGPVIAMISPDEISNLGISTSGFCFEYPMVNSSISTTIESIFQPQVVFLGGLILYLVLVGA